MWAKLALLVAAALELKRLKEGRQLSLGSTRHSQITLPIFFAINLKSAGKNQQLGLKILARRQEWLE